MITKIIIISSIIILPVTYIVIQPYLPAFLQISSCPFLAKIIAKL